MAEWANDANEALTLSLGRCILPSITLNTQECHTVRAEEDQASLGEEETYEDFHPNFTYPVRYGHFLVVSCPLNLQLDIWRRRKDLRVQRPRH
jgi:hypothetical protein